MTMANRLDADSNNDGQEVQRGKRHVAALSVDQPNAILPAQRT